MTQGDRPRKPPLGIIPCARAIAMDHLPLAEFTGRPQTHRLFVSAIRCLRSATRHHNKSVGLLFACKYNDAAHFRGVPLVGIQCPEKSGAAVSEKRATPMTPLAG